MFSKAILLMCGFRRLMKEIDMLKTITSKPKRCCSSKPIYEITYSLGTKWLVCYECLELECFKDDITEKVRIQA